MNFQSISGQQNAAILDVGKRCRIGCQNLRSEQHIVAPQRRKKLRSTNRRSELKTPFQQRGACLYRRFLVSVITPLKVRCRFDGTNVGTTHNLSCRNSRHAKGLRNRTSGLRNRRPRLYSRARCVKQVRQSLCRVLGDRPFCVFRNSPTFWRRVLDASEEWYRV